MADAKKLPPQFPPDQDMTDVSPEDVREARERARATQEYERSMTNTPPAPLPKPKLPQPPEKPKAKTYAKGGSVQPKGWGGARGGKSCKIC